MNTARILIVEDEAVTAMAIRKHLTNLGYSVCGITQTAELAIRKAMEEMVDLILMDIKLAGRRTGIPGEGAGFEIRVPEGRFVIPE